MSLDWKRRVLWKRGPLGTLHAQWIGEEVAGAAACNESAGLAGAAEEYAEGACPNCVRFALALPKGREAERTTARPRTKGGRVQDEESRRRADVLERRLRADGWVTAATLAEAWGLTPRAAKHSLEWEKRRGRLVKEYRVDGSRYSRPRAASDTP